MLNISDVKAMKSTNKILKAGLMKLPRQEMAFIIPVITNVKDLDSFLTSDMAVSLILNIVAKLSESCSASYLYSCKYHSVKNPSEAKTYNGSMCGRFLPLLICFSSFITKGFQ